MAGDAAALYNSLLLALRDAAKIPGRKVVILHLILDVGFVELRTR